ncbi:GNAT family N-acetyltransferase [Xenorhabdus sp. DI]|uniref:GNAT family N-acetyltransferase n=1 Tax=Xenorhabdus doucetiae TaxID=351671 RepID=UPI0019B4BAF7|nr:MULTISPECIES: GNAT family N-acetyltransferase [unclassified Xenorhabdus]MBD2785017.1 GNAT family N-acetyltransferase [Xenorhabdus sp. 3]MBD2787094.1 GNAT family N-acetyltransferase [Xenorhabdus sp. DI]
MPLFSKTITDFWQAPLLNGDIIYSDDVFTIATNANLEEEDRLMVLETTDGRIMAVMTPEMAEKAGLYHQEEMSESRFRQKLNQADITLHGADYIFYFSEEEKSKLLQENAGSTLRQLTEKEDGDVFSEFQSSASEQDLDNAYVELEHWAVFGSFEQNHLISAASMYPWNNAQIADMGVLTLESFRGQGHARKVVRAISQYAYAHGYEPQYRCQLDNLASLALAKAAGLTLFGKWELVSPDSTH